LRSDDGERADAAVNQIVAGIIGIALIGFIVYRLLYPGPKPNSRELAMTVWAAFGPYESVQDAEESLHRSIRAVFGNSNESEHVAWMNGHVENFRTWEASGKLKRSTNFMRRWLLLLAAGRDIKKACARYKEEAKADALQALDRIKAQLGLGEDDPLFLQMRGTVINNGVIPTEYDQAVAVSQRERAGRIVTSVGQQLFDSTSSEGTRLREFLQAISRKFKGEDAATPGALGLVYMQCMKYAHDNADSEPQFAATLHALNDAWKTTMLNDDTEVISILNADMIGRLLSSLSQPEGDKIL
jgi:hypothetical protein